jgi:hypothetical protein
MVEDFTIEAYYKTIDKMLATSINHDEIRQGAFKYYSLTKGVDNYNAVYCKLLAKTT